MASDKIVINAEHVSKKFSRRTSDLMKYGIEDITRNLLNLPAKTETLRKGEFWAVRDVSFSVKEGESLGLIGINGSGKTTVLKMLNGIFMPDTGRITMRGRIGALIQVGAGFHPMLTGRENIYVNGSVLGMSKAEIDRKFDSIVQFADIGDFLDTPVRHYSSGMFVRLGFAIAIHCEPDILLIDEILAVGDINFRRKCAKRMKQLQRKNVTKIFVTHDMGHLRHICDRAICLRAGEVIYEGDLDGAISQYMTTPFEDDAEPAQSAFIRSVSVDAERADGVCILRTGSAYTFDIQLTAPQNLKAPVLGFSIMDSMGTLVIGTNSRKDGVNMGDLISDKKISISFPFLNLIPGNYYVTVGLFDDQMNYIDELSNAMLFHVFSDNYSSGTVFTQHQWRVDG